MRISDWSSDVCSSDLRRWKRPAYHSSRLWGSIQDRTAVSEPPRERGGRPAMSWNWSFRSRVREAAGASRRDRSIAGSDRVSRSEEHTSELQSLMRISYAVFCLKKKHKVNN